MQAFAWDFDVFQFGQSTRGQPLATMTIALLELHGLMVRGDGGCSIGGGGRARTAMHTPACAPHTPRPPPAPAQDGWKVNRETMVNFLQQVEAGYSANQYHNNIHATDVLQTAAIILQSLAQQLGDIPKLDVFCILVASAVHDLGHLGVNNDFLINSRHPRATTYNDKSVNENYHISKAFELARTCKGCDIFELFTFEEQKKVGALHSSSGLPAWSSSTTMRQHVRRAWRRPRAHPPRAHAAVLRGTTKHSHKHSCCRSYPASQPGRAPRLQPRAVPAIDD